MSSGKLKAVFSGIIIAFIALIFVVQFTPTYESQVSSANISNTTTAGMVDLSVWVIPLLCIAGIVIAAVGFIGGARGKRGFANIELAIGLVPVIGWFALMALAAYHYFKQKQLRSTQRKIPKP